MSAEGSTTGWSSEDQSFLHTATELLGAGQYKHLAELLHRVQLAYDKQGDNIPAHVLVLARRICLACSQSQAEADWHQQACEEAAQREDKLRHQLATLLDLVSDRDPSVVPGEWDAIPQAPTAMLGPLTPSLSEPVEPLSLWQRIQGLLHWRLGPQPAESVPAELAKVVAWPPGDQDEKPAPSAIGDTDAWDVVAEETQVLASARAKEATRSVPCPTEQEAEAQPAIDAAEAHTSSITPEVESASPPAVADVKEKKQGAPSIVVYYLGTFQVYQDDRPVEDWPSSKGKSIFKYLAMHRERPVGKEVLMELFWPGAHPEAARNSLNVAIYGLRQALRRTRPSASHVLFQNDCYTLNPDLQIWVDVEAFQEHLAVAKCLEQQGDLATAMSEYRAAEALYQGDFLEEDLYEDWTSPSRERFQRHFLGLLGRLAQFYLEQADYAASTAVCRKMLVVDSCCEEAHRQLMCCYSRQGQHYLALRQYHQCMRTLRLELDVMPAESTTQLYEQVRQRVQV